MMFKHSNRIWDPLKLLHLQTRAWVVKVLTITDLWAGREQCVLAVEQLKTVAEKMDHKAVFLPPPSLSWGYPVSCEFCCRSALKYNLRSALFLSFSTYWKVLRGIEKLDQYFLLTLVVNGLVRVLLRHGVGLKPPLEETKAQENPLSK